MQYYDKNQVAHKSYPRAVWSNFLRKISRKKKKDKNPPVPEYTDTMSSDTPQGVDDFEDPIFIHHEDDGAPDDQPEVWSQGMPEPQG